jgi:hypothetical protein
MDEFLLLAAASSEAAVGELAAALGAEGNHLLDALGSASAGDAAARVTAVPSLPASDPAAEGFARVLERGLSNGVMLGGFDLVLDVDVPAGTLPELATPVTGLAARLGSRFDAERSAVVAGTPYEFVAGDGEFQLYYCMRCLPGVSHDQFSEYWRVQHSEIGRVTPGLAGYQQLHTDPDVSRTLATAAGVGVADIDGVALEWFATMDDLVTAVGCPPSHAHAAKSSEDNFNDISRVTAIVTHHRRVTT